MRFGLNVWRLNSDPLFFTWEVPSSATGLKMAKAKLLELGIELSENLRANAVQVPGRQTRDNGVIPVYAECGEACT